MSNTEINRQIVQKGLDRRKALRKEATQDAIERDFRAKCNKETESRRILCKADQKAQQLCQEEKEAINKKKMARKEAAFCMSWYTLMLKIVCSLMIAVMGVKFLSIEVLPLWAALPIVSVACWYSIDTFVAYVTGRYGNNPA